MNNTQGFGDERPERRTLCMLCWPFIKLDSALITGGVHRLLCPGEHTLTEPQPPRTPTIAHDLHGPAFSSARCACVPDDPASPCFHA